MISRRDVLRGLLGATLAGLASAGYALGVEPGLRLRVQRWPLRPANWTGPALRIVILADLHVGEPYMSLARVRRIVARAQELEGDLIVLLGDYAAGHKFVSRPVAISEVGPVLGQLTARLGTHAILGNHDWWDDPGAQARGGGPNLYATALEAAGVSVLSNRAVKLDGFWLAGLEDQLALKQGGRRFTGLDDLPGTMAQITDDAPVILLAHEPDIFPEVPAQVSLTLSGHTHGGQVRLFGWSPVVPSRFGNRYAYGPVEERGRHLVVSGGLGCSMLPVRFGMPPEITVVDLAAGA